MSDLRQSHGTRCLHPTALVLNAVAFVIALLFQQVVRAEEQGALHERIDKLISESTLGVAAPIVGDAEFLRRVSLDLIGIPPTVEELRAFLADQQPDKREKAVDRLLNHPRYARHMAEVFDVMLMERRPYQFVTEDEWRQYLIKAFRENRPYTQLAKEILGADGADPNPRAAVRFYLDRQADPNLLTRDVGRIFFGCDLQCAQCHDHPSINDYLQADYHGLLAFFQAGAAFTAPAPDGKTYYIEKAGANLVFESVFVSGKHTTGAKLLGLPEVDEPPLYPDEQYEVKPADNVRPVPKFSRRAKLAELAASGTNRAFNENIANRLWAHMMGRGLVEPVDMHHAANPPSNPALLQMLGEELSRGGFDIKAFLKTLSLTNAYQRSIDPPSDPVSYAPVAATFAAELEKQVQSLSAAASEADTQYAAATTEYCSVEEQVMPLVAELDQVTATATQAVVKLDDAKAQLAAAQAQIAAKTAVSQALSDAVAKTEAVAKALPQDQELVQAAQKFVDRQKQVAAEVGMLAKDAEQKTAAVDTSQQAMTAARQGIDAVRTKFDPLAKVRKEKQQLLTLARELWADRETVRANFEHRLDVAKRLAGLQPLRDAIAAAKERATTGEADLIAARAAVAAQQAIVSQIEQSQAAAELQLQQAATLTAAAQQEYAQANQLTAAVGAAIEKLEAAQSLLPNDAQLKEASQSLTAKLQELETAAKAPKQKLDDATAAQRSAEQLLASIKEQQKAVLAEAAQRQQKVAEGEQGLNAIRAEIDQQSRKLDDSLASLEEEWNKTFAVLPLKPLTPEQMCWSMLQVTGVYDRQLAAEQAELDKAAPLSEQDKQDAAKIAARELELQQRVYDKLKANVAVFVNLYAPSAGQPQNAFFASANQALFAANGGSVAEWTAPAAANVTERIIQQPDPKVAAEELYLTVLSRFPDEGEVADVSQYLTKRSQDKAASVRELVWGLLTSVEFRFNH